MSVKTHNFRIGLFVLVGALLFVGALFAMGLKAYFGQREVFETCVTGKVENLSVGALVMLRGVTIGKVSSIEFIGAEYPEYKEQYVLIQFEVPKGLSAVRKRTISSRRSTARPRTVFARASGQGFLGATPRPLKNADPELYLTEPVPWDSEALSYSFSAKPV